MTTYATSAEAIEREILPVLGGCAEDFDVRAIADDVLEYVTPEDDQGRLRVDRAGVVLKAGSRFWEGFSYWGTRGALTRSDGLTLTLRTEPWVVWYSPSTCAMLGMSPVRDGGSPTSLDTLTEEGPLP